MDDLENKTLSELKDIARSAGLSFSRMKKEELREKIRKYNTKHKPNKEKGPVEQSIPNEILSEIQKHADFDTAKNMGQSSAHLKSEFEKSSRKRCHDFMKQMFNVYLWYGYIPDEEWKERKPSDIPKLTLDQTIEKFSKILCINTPKLIKLLDKLDETRRKYGGEDDRVWDVRGDLYSMMEKCVPFHISMYDMHSAYYKAMFIAFLRNEDYTAIQWNDNDSEEEDSVEE